ncbi:OadG family transporter subunit [Clostridium sp.]|uniref:OadG family transporter subunit n=1 Tax=Clostridium sp. TaxID=1506 RepID=UPI001A3F7F2F|nr:OadG family transporter subunit [Clostridium sp.]MBK5237365.1 OadG family protein [Clostridium sp.]
MLGNEVSISQALNVSVGSIILVFSLLFLLSLILGLFKYIFKEKKVEILEEEKVISVQEEIICRNEIEIASLEEDDDIVACMAAIISASSGNRNSRIHITSIKRIN